MRERTTNSLREPEPQPQNAVKTGADGTAVSMADFAPPMHLAPAARPLLFHYHLFKNAGTSVDEMLRSNFGDRWAAQEFHVSRRENAGAVAEFIRCASHLLAVSSHTALLPPPQLPGITIFPIIFIRHPIDRLRSAYEFERQQNANTAGARLAKTHDFAGYVRDLLRNLHQRHIRNFQTLRLSHNEPASKGPELQRALRAVNNLPFVGLVERFDDAIDRLQAKLQPLFPDFRARPVHQNATRARQAALDDRLADVERALGKDLYTEVRAANADDLAIYSMISSEYGP